MARPRDIHGGDIWLASRSSGSPASKIIDFSASINPLGLPASVEKALRQSIKTVGPYPDPASIELREAIASFHSISPDEIVAANGSNELISLLPMLFSGGGGPALLVEPAFSEYRKALGLHGVKARSLVLGPASGFSLDPGRLMKAIEGCSAVYIANPSNPAGVVTPEKTLLDIISSAKRKGVIVVIDEAFADFTGVSVIPAAVKAANVVVLRSMTKFYAMAGLRLGYAVANRRLAARLGSFVPAWSVNRLASVAGVAALGDRAFCKRTLEWFRSERESLFRGLSAIEGLEVFAPSANYVMARLPYGMDSKELRRALLEEEGMLIRELSAFRGLGPRYFRAAVLKREDNRRLVEALRRRIKGACAGRGRRAGG